MNVLVTGGAGFIGSNLTQALLADGARVTVLDNFSSGHRSNLQPQPGLSIVEGDIRNHALVDEVMRNVEMVFHLAASVGNRRAIENPVMDSDVNVLGTLKVLMAAKAHNVRKLVISSSAAVYGEPCRLPIREDHPLDPQTPYACSKLAAETQSHAYRHLYGIEIVSLRYFNVYGQHQRYDAYGNVIPIFARQILDGEPITIYGDGEQTRDFVHVDDVVAANISAANTKGLSGTFNIASGNVVSVNALTKVMLQHGTRRPPVLNGAERAGDVRHSSADIDAARRGFNFRPKVGLEEGVARYMDWLTHHLTLPRTPERRPHTLEDRAHV
ncbi:MAG: NAD-dependent epimerase/dehydratase family protein [Pseudomonadota bacterium]